MKGARQILIVQRDSGNFALHEGERYVTDLNFDEMLGCVARMTHRPRYDDQGPYGMDYPEGHQRRGELRAQRQRERDARIAAELQRDTTTVMASIDPLKAAVASSELATALWRLVRWNGNRHSDHSDELMPPRLQAPEIRTAMELLEKLKGDQTQ